MTSPSPDPVRPVSARLVDPEDDLAVTAYSADAETTRIPMPDAMSQPGPSTGYGLAHNPEPLPYVEPQAQPQPQIQSFTDYGPPAMPTEIVPVDADERAGKRGTLDLGLLLLRVTVGVLFIAHGLQKAFGWWGGPGLDGLKTSLAEAGYQNADVLTYVTAGAQIASGVLLVLGLFTPLAGAVALGLAVNGVIVALDAQRRDGGIFVLGSERVEYLLLLAVAVAVIILAGPGRYGFDGGRGWARRPFVGSFLALVLGVGGGVAAWFFLRGINPFA